MLETSCSRLLNTEIFRTIRNAFDSRAVRAELSVLVSGEKRWARLLHLDTTLFQPHPQAEPLQVLSQDTTTLYTCAGFDNCHRLHSGSFTGFTNMAEDLFAQLDGLQHGARQVRPPARPDFIEDPPAQYGYGGSEIEPDPYGGCEVYGDENNVTHAAHGTEAFVQSTDTGADNREGNRNHFAAHGYGSQRQYSSRSQMPPPQLDFRSRHSDQQHVREMLDSRSFDLCKHGSLQDEVERFTDQW